MSNWKQKTFIGLILEWICFAGVVLGILGAPAIGLVKIPYIRIIAASCVLIGCLLSILIDSIHDNEAWKFELGMIQFAIKIILGLIALAWLASLIKIKDPTSIAATVRKFCNRPFNWKWPIVELVFIIDRWLHFVARVISKNDFVAVAYRELYVVLTVITLVAFVVIAIKFPNHDNPGKDNGNDTQIENDGDLKEKWHSFEEMVLAAEEGSATAQYELGIEYYKGEKITQSYSKAFEWFLKAANQGNAEAEAYLGILYYEGKGIQQDYKQAVEWFQNASEKDSHRAQCFLGILYIRGIGVGQDYDKAFALVSNAASAGYEQGEVLLGYCYECGYGAEVDYTKAIEWYTKAAVKGMDSAEYRLGRLYYYGIGTEKDITKAMEWLSKAAEQNNADSQVLLGLVYYFGENGEQDYKKAYQWFSKAAEQGNASGQYRVGIMYHNGLGIDKDYGKALEWFQKAADQGNSSAMYLIGNMYYYGAGVSRDYVTAEAWYQKAADAGDKDGMYYLGELHRNGYLGSVDLSEAKKWYQKAAEGGNEKAQEVMKAFALDTKQDSVNKSQYVDGYYKGVVNKDGTTLKPVPGTKDANGQKIDPMLTEDGQSVTLNKGDSVLIYGERKDVDLDNWYHVVCSFNGKVYSGYVYFGRVTREGSIIAD